MTGGMMFKGTPGPWDIGTDSSDYGNSWWYTVGPAQVGGGRHGDECVEATADSHLIAAAPDLLEALTRILAEYDRWKGYNDDGFEDETEAFARAAIKKALGEQK